MKSLYIISFLFLTQIGFSQVTYTCEEAKFSVEFEGNPAVKPEGKITDILYEAPNATTTYIASFKKEETKLIEKEYCNYLKEKIKNNSELNLSFSKIIDFNGLTALKYETTREVRYIMFTYETIAFKYNGYEIELIAMSKEEDLDFRDLDKFAKTFKVLE